ncbi:hypothetical protein KY289_008652 [Solanum tuberosum]|nr:hypothetical protein KY289_008652 [Solanum tuberosum]
MGLSCRSGHVMPAIQVAPRGNEAGPSNQPPRVVPYPYQLDEVIGGDSVQSIQQRLLAKYSYTPPIGIMYLAEIEAKDLFEVKQGWTANSINETLLTASSLSIERGRETTQMPALK